MTVRNVFTFISDVMAKDYYQILGIKKDATDRQIKKAFRKLALQYHPDKNKSKDAETKFREIAEAYDILSDPDKKAKYDQFGDAAFNEGSAGPGGHTFDYNEFFKQFDDAFKFHGKQRERHYDHGSRFRFNGINLDDLFSDFEFDMDSFGHHEANHFHAFENEFHGFGSGDSFFGSHFGVPLAAEFGGGHSHRESCRTVTKKMGGTVMTMTECS